MTAYRKFDKWIYFTIVGIIVILYTLIEWRFPVMCDDLGLLSIWNSYDVDNSSFPQIISNTYYDIWIHQNGRISNTIAPLAVAFPVNNFIFSLLTGVAMAFLIELTRKFACIGNPVNRNFFMSLSWLLLLFFLPWNDLIFIADCALNYIFASVLTMLFIFALLELEKNGWRPVYLFVMILFAALTALWHEGFSCTTLVGIGLYIIVKRFKVSPKFYLVTSVYAVCFIICFYAPGTQNRLQSVIASERPVMGWLDYCMFFIPMVFLCFSYAFFLFFREGRKSIVRSFKNPFVIIGWGIIISGFFISSMPGQPLRSTFWPGVFCIVSSLALLPDNQWFKRFFSKKSLLMNSLSVFMALACVAQGIVTLYWVDKFRRQSDYIMERMIYRDQRVVFYDLLQKRDIPRVALGIPPTMMWHVFFNYFCIWLYHPADFLTVVPTDLQYADIHKGIPLSGDIRAKRIGNYIVGPYRIREDEPNLVIPRDVLVETVDGNNLRENFKVLEMPFITEKFLHEDSVFKADTLMYYKFDQNVDPRKIRNIKIFNLLETLDY